MFATLQPSASRQFQNVAEVYQNFQNFTRRICEKFRKILDFF
jgi:hypothetical protein